MKHPNILALTLLVIAQSACGSAGTTTAVTPPPPGQAHTPGTPGLPQPYVMTGTVMTEAGAPLAGVEVFADHTAYYNMNAVGITDAQGRYRIALARQPGTWSAGAYLKVPLDGETFDVRLRPQEDMPFDGAQGAVRHFTYTASDAPTDKVYTYAAHTDVELDDGSLQLTFTPEGPNVLGSTAPFTRRFVVGSGMPDVPLGRYHVRVTHVLNGAQQSLLLGTRDQPGSAA